MKSCALSFHFISKMTLSLIMTGTDTCLKVACPPHGLRYSLCSGPLGVWPSLPGGVLFLYSEGAEGVLQFMQAERDHKGRKEPRRFLSPDPKKTPKCCRPHEKKNPSSRKLSLTFIEYDCFPLRFDQFVWVVEICRPWRFPPQTSISMKPQL